MRTFATRPAVLYGSLLLLSAGFAFLLLWAISQPHRPIEYMVAGTMATAVALVAVFVFLLTRRRI